MCLFVRSRETIKSNVFVPRMEGPSISLEEFGDMEKAAAMERSKKQAEGDAEGCGEVLRYY